MKVRLYTIPGSHPGIAVQLMLNRKRIDFDRTDLMPMVSKLAMRAFGFPGTAVPAARIDGRRIQGSIAIARELERLRPDPPLYPTDAGARTTVEQIENFCDVGLQHPIRQAVWWGFKRDRWPMKSYSEGAHLGVPIDLAVKTGAPLVALAARYNRASDENVRAGLASLPGLLKRLDDWVDEGVLGGPEPNAADFQVAASLGLAMTMADLRPHIEPRPCGQLALGLMPDFPGYMPPTLPPAWLSALASEEAASAAA